MNEYVEINKEDILSEISEIEAIAVHSSIRTIRDIRRRFGRARWRKMKGIATVRVEDGKIVRAEIHWYEAHGIGKKSIKVKRVLD